MIGIDPHKRTHSAVATDELGHQLAERTQPAKSDGFGALLVWARALDCDRVWVIEDCRHVSGPFERFLLYRGETVVRLPPQLMAGARTSVRERGKSDPIDALAVARAALRCAKGSTRSRPPGSPSPSSRFACSSCTANGSWTPAPG
ncbi:MAG: IS110 family transposase [Solirubrobacteraceae bacterium]